MLFVLLGFVLFYLIRPKSPAVSAWQFTRAPLAWTLLPIVSFYGWKDLALAAVLLLYTVPVVVFGSLLIGRYVRKLPWRKAAVVETNLDQEKSVEADESPSPEPPLRAFYRVPAKTRWVAASAAVLLAAGGVWYGWPSGDPDFREYDACLLQHIPGLPASTPEQYQASVYQIKEGCMRLHPVTLDIEVLARAKPGSKSWDEFTPEILVNFAVSGPKPGVSGEGIRDSYFNHVIAPRVHPDFQPQVREAWNRRVAEDVKSLQAAIDKFGKS